MSTEFFVSRLEYLGRWGHWRWLKTPIAGAATSELGAMWAQVDWAHVFPVAGLAITAIGTAVIGLYRYWRLTAIEIEIRERDAHLRGSQIDTSSVPPARMEPGP